MRTLTGTPISPGIASGPLFFVRPVGLATTQVSVADPAPEHERVNAALARALGELTLLQDKARAEVGENEAEIFGVHQMMLTDEDFQYAIHDAIESQRVNAEWAVRLARDTFATMFAQLDDPYMRERAADVTDVAGRLIGCLGTEQSPTGPTTPSVIAAEELTPSQTIQLDRALVLAIVTAGGSPTSHAAILARTMGVPAIIGLGDALSEDLHGTQVGLDGSTGELFVDPDGPTRDAIAARAREVADQRASLEAYRGLSNTTKDGHEVLVYSNIGSPAEVDLVLANDSGGVGLFRSEFIFLESEDYPDEEAQFGVYRAVVEGLGGRRSVLRTLDIGADKRIGYFGLDEEENPALGLRGLRLCLERPGLFTVQLRAMLRASAFGPVSIMVPMVASAWEIGAAREALEGAKAGLRADGLAYDEGVEFGIMIETPAAALIADRLAPMVDFFSVGTNDLTQYTLAVDRQNSRIDRFCDTHHEAVLTLIEMAAKAAHAHGKWIGICGELGADLSLTERFLTMGIDELSVSPAKTLALRAHIRSLTLPLSHPPQ